MSTKLYVLTYNEPKVYITFQVIKNLYHSIISHNELVMEVYFLKSIAIYYVHCSQVTTWDAHIRPLPLDSLQKRTLKANLNAICFRVEAGSVDLAEIYHLKGLGVLQLFVFFLTSSTASRFSMQAY